MADTLLKFKIFFPLCYLVSKKIKNSVTGCTNLLIVKRKKREQKRKNKINIKIELSKLVLFLSLHAPLCIGKTR